MVVTDHSVLQIRFSSDPINEFEKNFVDQKGKVIMEGYKLHEDIFFVYVESGTELAKCYAQIQIRILFIRSRNTEGILVQLDK